MVLLEKKHGKYIWWVWDWFLVFGTNSAGQTLWRLLSGHWLQLKDKHSNESEPMLNHYLFWKQSQAKIKTLGEITENNKTVQRRETSLPSLHLPQGHFFQWCVLAVPLFRAQTWAQTSPSSGADACIANITIPSWRLCVSLPSHGHRTRLLKKARLPLFPLLQRFHFGISWFRDFWSL